MNELKRQLNAYPRLFLMPRWMTSLGKPGPWYMVWDFCEDTFEYYDALKLSESSEPADKINPSWLRAKIPQRVEF